jgi:hypothetical protein
MDKVHVSFAHTAVRWLWHGFFVARRLGGFRMHCHQEIAALIVEYSLRVRANSA